MSRLPTVTDVAEAAGVSRQTVSNVLNAPDRVREATRERVSKAIEELGYRPHASARRLRTQTSSTIGIRLDPVSDGISGSILDRFLHALTEQADAVGLRVLLYTALGADDEIRQLARLVDGADVDAFVLTSTYYGDPRTDWLIERGQRFVTFGRPWGINDMTDPAHAWVDVDGRDGVRQATEHLLEAGHRRIGYIGWPSGSGTGDDRHGGWAETLRTASVPDLDGLVERAEDSVSAGTAAMRRLMSRNPGLEAVVTASDGLALGALVAASGTTPVVGFDNTPVAASLGFSSVDQQLTAVASGVLELLTDSTNGPRHRLIAPELVVREETLR
ncbi:DNA-binding transcriptional regulator, LacI/PurR family [Paramicrobacterium humi]|uniref:DNA-binding transcriptional regulator, LacI/PurR family n=1 Tax=Paramicrobacterium humi TaxID=640635 RepID=A0A1H4JLW6_9MICO|nr:LacI family DNA-binding transcriptional regulator [Microbacterium humi]SEB47300.1 DNA-binding transcriptional regulator, LacI/PurR family [Microbacterium humi]